MEKITYIEWLKNQSERIAYSDSIYAYLNFCKSNSIELSDDLKIQMLTEILDFIPEVRDELDELNLMNDLAREILTDEKKSIQYFDWLKLFRLKDGIERRVDFVKFCALNNLWLSDDLKVFFLQEEDDQFDLPEAAYMLWKINGDKSLLFRSASQGHEAAIHELADILDFSEGWFIEDSCDAPYFMQCVGGSVDERYYESEIFKEKYLREIADEWLYTSARLGSISSKYKLADNTISKIIWRCEGTLEDRKYDYYDSALEFKTAWAEIVECAKNGDRDAIKYLIRTAEIECLSYDAYMENFSLRVRETLQNHPSGMADVSLARHTRAP